MKRILLSCFTGTLLLSLAAVAQSTKQDEPATKDTANVSAQEKQAAKPIKETETVTGCLQKGDEVGEFSIAGDDGKVWGLHSSTVKLEDHIGHKVTLVGTARGESKAEEKKEKKEGAVVNASQKEEYGNIRVTSLKMISDTCAK